MKIVFFGTSEFVNPVLNKLQENFEVVRAIRTPQQLNNETIEQMRTLGPDLFVVASFGKILTKEILEIPKLGAINIHPSLLPKYRGSTPIQTAILNGDDKTGVSFIKMDEKIDHGELIEQFEEEILSTDTFDSLAKRLFQKSADKLPAVVTSFDGGLKLKQQDESKATYTKTLTRQDGYIDPDNPPEIEQLDRMIRAYFPWPGVFTNYPLHATSNTLIKFLPDKKIQVEGKKPMSYKDFINGYPNGITLLEKLKLVARG